MMLQKIVLGTLPDGNDHFSPPFYITLELQDLYLNNFLYYSGASHSLMPFLFMEKLGLDITRPYKDLYSFDSKRVQCLGIIKYLVVGMVQIQRKFWIMDVVIADVPPTYGMLLSRHINIVWSSFLMKQRNDLVAPETPPYYFSPINLVGQAGNSDIGDPPILTYRNEVPETQATRSHSVYSLSVRDREQFHNRI